MVHSRTYRNSSSWYKPERHLEMGRNRQLSVVCIEKCAMTREHHSPILLSHRREMVDHKEVRKQTSHHSAFSAR